MSWSTHKLEGVLLDPTAFTCATFGPMTRIQQNDIPTENGEISMAFLREVGIPQKSDQLLLLRSITFDVATSPLSTVETVFKNFGLSPVKEISDNLCLNLIPNTDSRKKVSVIYIDVRDDGKIKRFTYSPNPSNNNEKQDMFVNSTISQYIYTLAFSLAYWRSFPSNEEFDANGEDFAETVCDIFFRVIHALDEKAIPASEKEWGHKSQNSTYWTEFFEYFSI